MVASKIGACVVLRGILNLPIDEDAIPDPDHEDLLNIPETIVEASVVRAADGVVVEAEDSPGI